jgi:KDO2-lipid IV(A) lauroyltransferase
LLNLIYIPGRVVGFLLYVLRARRYYYCCANIRLCFPAYNENEVKRLARQSLCETGKLLFEFLFQFLVPVSFFRRSICKVVGEEHILKARAQGRGVILAGPHLGNWEVFNVYAGGLQSCVMYKPLTCGWLNRWLRSRRESNGSKLVSIAPEGLRVLCGDLGACGVVALFVDQVPAESAGRVVAPFFGMPAWTGTLLSRLARKNNAVVICGFARRLPGGRGYEIYLEPAPAEIYSEDLEQSAAALNKGLEACIRQFPEQYTWTYKRFKQCVHPDFYKRPKSLRQRYL